MGIEKGRSVPIIPDIVQDLDEVSPKKNVNFLMEKAIWSWNYLEMEW